MLDDISKSGLAVVGGIITLAIVAVFISKKSATPQVLQATGNVLAQVIQAAVSPQATAATNGNPNLDPWSTSGSPFGLTPSMQNENEFGSFLNSYVP